MQGPRLIVRAALILLVLASTGCTFPLGGSLAAGFVGGFLGGLLSGGSTTTTTEVTCFENGVQVPCSSVPQPG
jgi:hypothetical protein